MSSYRIIPSDDHVVELPDLWTTRIEPKFRERCPRVERIEDGTDWWFCDGRKVQGLGSGAQVGRRFEDPDRMSIGDLVENVRPGAFIPDEHVKDMDLDGVDVSILYPTAGLQLYSTGDGELLTAIFRVYSDWVAEYCSAYPDRLKGIAMLNVDEVEPAVRELERCARLGLVGAMITVYPPDDRPYSLPEYEPLWAAAQDLDIPLSLHFGTNRAGAGQEFGDLDSLRPSFSANTDHWVRMSLGDMIFSGVFERYPKLQAGSIEMELSWVPHFLDRIDYTYTQRVRDITPYRFKEDMLPSDYFHRNVFLGFQEDGLGIRLRDLIGVDQLMWGSDYPHFESTFPRSREILEDILVGCTEEEKAKIVGENAARVYRLD